jgi:hypothetical protein
MTAPAAWWPVATRRPVANTASPHPGEGDFLYEVAGRFTQDPLGWAFHVVVGNGSPYETFLRAKSPKRRFSHIWVAKDGDVEQYGPFSHKSWANGIGNGSFYSAETEGFPEEPLTDAQVHRLAEFHIFTETADRIAASTGEKGIVCHYQGSTAWGGHSCPDPAPGGQGPRSHQRAQILAAVARLRTPNPKARENIRGPLGPGSTGGSVRIVQDHVHVRVDGAYGPITEASVRRFQTAHHLAPDGIVGRLTAGAMGCTYTAV